MARISDLVKLLLAICIGLATCNGIANNVNSEEPSKSKLGSSFFLQICYSLDSCKTYYFKKISVEHIDTLGIATKNPYLCIEPKLGKKADTITVYLYE